MKLKALLTILFATHSVILSAQNQQAGFGIAYYNVGELRRSQLNEGDTSNTLSSNNQHNRHSTTQRRARWNAQLYTQQIRRTIEVIDSIALPVIILYGIESEDVVRDLVSLSSRDYAYIYRDQNISNGLEFAVLYEGDRFFPEKVTCWDKALAVKGQVGKGEITIIANVRCRSIGALIEELGIDAKSDKIVLIGQPSKPDFEQFGLRDATLPVQRQQRGNYALNGGWIMRDRVATNITDQSVCDVFIKSWLLDNFGKPAGITTPKSNNKAGSAALPVYIYFKDLFAY